MKIVTQNLPLWQDLCFKIQYLMEVKDILYIYSIFYAKRFAVKLLIDLSDSEYACAVSSKNFEYDSTT